MQCSKITNTRRFKTRTSESIPLATLILRELISASGWSSKAHTSMKTNLYLLLVNYANLPLLGLRKRFKFILLVGPPITQVSDHIQHRKKLCWEMFQNLHYAKTQFSVEQSLEQKKRYSTFSTYFST